MMTDDVPVSVLQLFKITHNHPNSRKWYTEKLLTRALSQGILPTATCSVICAHLVDVKLESWLGKVRLISGPSHAGICVFKWSHTSEGCGCTVDFWSVFGSKQLPVAFNKIHCRAVSYQSYDPLSFWKYYVALLKTYWTAHFPSINCKSV